MVICRGSPRKLTIWCLPYPSSLTVEELTEHMDKSADPEMDLDSNFGFFYLSFLSVGYLMELTGVITHFWWGFCENKMSLYFKAFKAVFGTSDTLSKWWLLLLSLLVCVFISVVASAASPTYGKLLWLLRWNSGGHNFRNFLPESASSHVLGLALESWFARIPIWHYESFWSESSEWHRRTLPPSLFSSLSWALPTISVKPYDTVTAIRCNLGNGVQWKMGSWLYLRRAGVFFPKITGPSSCL